MDLFTKTAHYIPLEEESDSLQPNGHQKRRTPIYQGSRWIWLLHLTVGLSWILAFFTLRYHENAAVADSNSPLSSAVEYETIRFATGWGEDLTIYQGAPNQVNQAAWANLPNTGIVALNAGEHAKIPYDSVLFDKDAGTYLGAIELFQQFHCLNMHDLTAYADAESLNQFDSGLSIGKPVI